MLTKEDLGQIREVIVEVVPGIVHDVVQPMILASETRVIKTIVEAVGDLLDQSILPQLDNIYDDIKVIKQDVSVLKQDIRGINAKMITRGGLEDRLTDFRLSFVPATR